jgi:N-acetylmuramoyl-L-alanine amidase
VRRRMHLGHVSSVSLPKLALWRVLFSAVFLLLVSTESYAEPSTEISFEIPLVSAEVAVDVGHYLAKPGATAASGKSEFSLNLALAQEVTSRLRKASLTTRLIGADGQMAVLTDRTALAAKDRLFVSLHHDSIQPEWMERRAEFSGFSIFVSRRNPQLAASLACASAVGKRLLEAGFQPSRYHVIAVNGENRPFADEANGVHYFDDLAVLRSAKQAAILVEAGVIVNPEDEVRVSSAVGRERIAQAIADGSQECLSLQVQPDGM